MPVVLRRTLLCQCVTQVTGLSCRSTTCHIGLIGLRLSVGAVGLNLNRSPLEEMARTISVMGLCRRPDVLVACTGT